MALWSGHGTWDTHKEAEVGRWEVGVGFPCKVEKKQIKSQSLQKQRTVQGVISALIISSFIAGHQ